RVSEPAVDVVVATQDVADPVDGGEDLWVVEGDLVVDPLVVHLGARFAQDGVFHPVGRRPAGGAAGFDAGAPGAGAVVIVVVGDLLGEIHHLAPRFGHLVAVVGERLRRVPDEGFHRGHERGGVEGAVDRAVSFPVLRPPVVSVRLHRFGGGNDVSAVDHRLQEPGLGEHGEVGRV